MSWTFIDRLFKAYILSGTTFKELDSMGKRILFIMVLFVAIFSIVLVILNKHPSLASNDGTKSVKKTVNMQKDINQKENVPKVGLEVGDIAPNLTLENLAGQTDTLSQYRGKKVLLNFWATWCSPCQEEIPQLVQFDKKPDHNKIVILGVNLTAMETGGVQAVKTFSQKHGMSFPILLDTKEDAMITYGVVTIPTTYLLNEQGVITAKHIGPIDVAWINEQFK